MWGSGTCGGVIRMVDVLSCETPKIGPLMSFNYKYSLVFSRDRRLRDHRHTVSMCRLLTIDGLPTRPVSSATIDVSRRE